MKLSRRQQVLLYSCGRQAHGLTGACPPLLPQAKEFGEAEVWMNERMMRFAPDACARFLTAFADQGTGPRKEDACIWLVWKDEGMDTLYDLILVSTCSLS